MTAQCVAAEPNYLVGALAHALALRYASLAKAIAQTAAFHGIEPSELSALPDFATMRSRYLDLLDEWLGETPCDSHGIHALAKFATSIIGDRQCQSALSQGRIAGEDEDHHHVMIALGTVCRWLNDRSIDELVESRTKGAQSQRAS